MANIARRMLDKAYGERGFKNDVSGIHIEWREEKKKVFIKTGSVAQVICELSTVIR